MKTLSGKVAAVTGAGSGIGRALAVRLAKEGCHLALSDINLVSLEQTQELITADRVSVSLYQVDVADRDQVRRYASDAATRHGGVDLVINNAGLTVLDSIEDIVIEDFERVMNVDFWGVVHGTQAFLPHLRTAPEGHVVNVGSIHSFMANARNGAYCAAKSAIRGFTESLGEELRGSSIHVTLVMPGGVKTNIVSGSVVSDSADAASTKQAFVDAHAKASPTSPEKAADIMIRAILRNRRRVPLGPDAHFYDVATRLAPVTTTWAYSALAKRLTGGG